ncbi:MAG: FAD-dependent oxidoreductase [Bacilli bacterium]|nr:FAD-dependent oxidoreductase [Bacilli bacterium]
MNKIYDSVIIGAGPCGIGAGIALNKEGLDVVIVERDAPGGKINIAPRVDNYPGFKEVPGPDLAVAFYERVLQNNVPFIGDEILSLKKEGNLFLLKGANNEYLAKTVLIASGTKERVLGLPNEIEFFGKGISYCAVCDGHFFKGQDVLVIGGGNTALKEAVFLTDIAKHVYLIHRRNEFRGSKKIVEELLSHENATILTPYIPLEFLGEDKLNGAKIQNVETKEIKTLEVQGAFPLVGQIPNSKFIKLEGVTNEWGNIPVDKNMMTSVPGLFAGGDILPRDIRQIYLAEHDGVVAAKSIVNYLKEN